MSMIYVLLPLSLLLAGCGLVAFLWSVRRGQFDDLDTPPLRMLGDEAEAKRRDDDPPS